MHFSDKDEECLQFPAAMRGDGGRSPLNAERAQPFVRPELGQGFEFGEAAHPPVGTGSQCASRTLSFQRVTKDSARHKSQGFIATFLASCVGPRLPLSAHFKSDCWYILGTKTDGKNLPGITD
ncbi:hypothetical protein A6X20_38840 [Bradyrhizobium elkanii]|nr:hypothetical protein A6X20_38840 [Bradyrhizobium elkanii]ODM76858.1 hypothetical protein A6452_01480 [Bradyrhizobium elkanii]